MTRVAWISNLDPPDAFPDVRDALREPDGLLAAGGDLSTERLLYAYRHGIFPWYETGQPPLWWSPDPRCVLVPDRFHCSRRQWQYIRRSARTLSFNQDFASVIRNCAADRRGLAGTWITPEMERAYSRLHDLGWAHSVEIWEREMLVGGLYGVAIGRLFFGESMFSAMPNASKMALLGLCRELSQRGFVLLDCQLVSPHLLSLGATRISRGEFVKHLASACDPPTKTTDWPRERIAISDLSGH